MVLLSWKSLSKASASGRACLKLAWVFLRVGRASGVIVYRVFLWMNWESKSKYPKPQGIVEAKEKSVEKGLVSDNFGCFGLNPAVPDDVVGKVTRAAPRRCCFRQFQHPCPNGAVSQIQTWCQTSCLREKKKRSISFDKIILLQFVSVSFIFSVFCRELSADRHHGIDKIWYPLARLRYLLIALDKTAWISFKRNAGKSGCSQVVIFFFSQKTY